MARDETFKTIGWSPYHDLVWAFRTALIRHALAVHRGNRTRTARALGLQRTYLLRLIREMTAAGLLIEAPIEPDLASWIARHASKPRPVAHREPA